MSVKQAVRQHYVAEVDLTSGGSAAPPAEGWIRTVRKALGMSGAQLGSRLGLTRARIAQAEQAELEGGITLKSMQAMAEAMGCRFVYSFVPPGTIENIVVEQARKKAEAIVGEAQKHMALESQTVQGERTEREIDRMTQDLIREMPRDFWQDD